MLSASDFAKWTGGSVGALEAPPAAPPPLRLVTWPNAITLSGYAAGLAWVAGGPASLALWSLLADELDGVSARNLGEESSLGASLDHGVDVCMMALVGMKLGFGWVALPLVLLGQMAFKELSVTPPVGSFRASAMVYALTKGL